MNCPSCGHTYVIGRNHNPYCKAHEVERELDQKDIMKMDFPTLYLMKDGTVRWRKK